MKHRLTALALCAALLLSGCAASDTSAPAASTASPPAASSASGAPGSAVPSGESTPSGESASAGQVPAQAQPAMADVDPAALPESLAAFLRQFAGFFKSPPYSETGAYGKEYDAASAAGGEANILASILSEGPCVDFTAYPGVMPEQHWDGGDPVGWSFTGAYAIHDGPTADWIACNIFNVPEADLPALIRRGEEAKLFLRQEDAAGGYTYYVPLGGIGDPMKELRFFWAQSDGTRYRLAYELYSTAPDPADSSRWILEGTYYAELRDKEIDGAHYWALDLHTAQLPADVPQAPEAGSPAP